MAYSEITFTRKKLPSTQIVYFVLIRIMTHHCRVRDLVAAFEKPSIEAPHRKLPLWQGRGSQDPRQRFMDLSIMSRMQPREDPMEYVQKCVEATTTQDEFLKTSRPYGGVPPHVMEKPTWQCCGLCGSKVFRNTAKWMPGMVADEQECDRRHTENCKCHKGTQPMRRSTFPYQCISCERYVCMRCFDNRLGPKDEWSDAEMDQMMCKLCTHKVRDASSFPMKMPLTWKWGSGPKRLFFFRASQNTLAQELPRRCPQERKWPDYVRECKACKTEHDRWTHYSFQHACGAPKNAEVPGMSWSINASLALSRAVHQNPPFVHVAAVSMEQLELDADLNASVCCLWDADRREARRSEMTEPDFEKHNFHFREMKRSLYYCTGLREVVTNRQLVAYLPCITLRTEDFTKKMRKRSGNYWYYNECCDNAWRTLEIDIRSHVLSTCIQTNPDVWQRWQQNHDHIDHDWLRIGSQSMAAYHCLIS